MRLPKKKKLTFMIEGKPVHYVHVSHIETLSGSDHALVDGTFFAMTKNNT